ncbi:GPI anchored serine-threonine rich protein [Colletotrichum karsti]|uniref:GPI anchored serine-threonine rich protein n=1 Tax=Colletotrichum karsti TaxID=1095194 RepID=A0A9P6LNY8_9PEZI|nr:GPI anchored serine-threonine rich protein [Colletotrichum karsti]KAF9880200.1 GPI anchored serine-threonine rich protein [Colletotrichum karsti]
MLKTLLFLGLSVATSFAYEDTLVYADMTPANPVLFKRQTVPCSDIGRKNCGDGCILISYTCCPDGAGGCPTASTYCQVGSNGQYGCCARGKTCVGDGGTKTDTIPGGIVFTTSTTTLRFTDGPSVIESTSTATSTSTISVDVPEVSTVTPEDTTTSTSTKTSASALTSDVSEEATTTFAAPTSTPTSIQTPPVTVNAALNYGASAVQAAAAALMALLAI